MISSGFIATQKCIDNIMKCLECTSGAGGGGGGRGWYK